MTPPHLPFSSEDGEKKWMQNKVKQQEAHWASLRVVDGGRGVWGGSECLLILELFTRLLLIFTADSL